MNVKQLAFVNLLTGWCQAADGVGSNLVAASYAVIGNQLKVTPVAAFLRTKTLEKHGWVKRKDGKLYLHPKFSKGSEEEWAAL
jgi:hypothetical protein